MSILYTGAMVSLAIFSYITYAWFTTQTNATVNFASMKVDSGISANLKYCKQNGGKDNYYLGYAKGNQTTLFNKANWDTYANNFSTPTNLSAQYNQIYAPGYASSFSIEIKNDSISSKNVNVYLRKFVSVGSTLYFTDDDNKPIALDRAMDVYTGCIVTDDASALTTYARGFLQSDTANSDDGVTVDRFAHTEATASTGLAVEDQWNGNTITLASGKTAYFFITLYFSNADSTLYKVSGSDATSSSAASHYQVTQTASADGGSSNVYSGLSILFSELYIRQD